MARIRWEFVQGIEEPVAWVDLAAFDAAWRQTAEYIGPGGKGSLHGGRYTSVGKYLARHTALWYPHVSLREGLPVFTDGRHRSAWLRDHGAAAIPMTTSPADRKRLEQAFGTAARETLFRR